MAIVKIEEQRKFKAQSIYDLHKDSNSWITTAQSYPLKKLNGERYWFQRHEKGEIAFKEEMAKHLDKVTDYNSYFSINSFSRPQRIEQNLFRLNALYADIDWHSDSSIDYKVVLEILEKHFFSASVPIPTHIVFTGRGLQLYWQIEHAPKQALKFWTMIENLLIDELDKISDYLPTVGVDHACKSVAQVFRASDTWHVIGEKFAQELKLDYLHQYQYTLSEIADCYFMDVWDLFDKNHAKYLKSKKSQKQFEAAMREKIQKQQARSKEEKQASKKKIKSLFNSFTLRQARIHDLNLLLELRGFDMRDYRDRFFFYYAWTFATEKTSLDNITYELMAVNNKMKYPLSEAEIIAKANETFTRLPKVKAKVFRHMSAEELDKLQKSKDGKVFRGFRNSTMIKNLNITKAEMQSGMKTIIDKREKYDRSNKKRRDDRRDEEGNLISRLPVIERRAKVKELMDLGYKQKQIAEALGIDVEVVKNDRRAINKELKKAQK